MDSGRLSITSTTYPSALKCSIPRLRILRHEIVCAMMERCRCSTKGEVGTGQHFLERVDDTLQAPDPPQRRFDFACFIKQSVLQIHSNLYKVPSKWAKSGPELGPSCLALPLHIRIMIETKGEDRDTVTCLVIAVRYHSLGLVLDHDSPHLLRHAHG
jgi:hypothetical protein